MENSDSCTTSSIFKESQNFILNASHSNDEGVKQNFSINEMGSGHHKECIVHADSGNIKCKAKDVGGGVAAVFVIIVIILSLLSEKSIFNYTILLVCIIFTLFGISFYSKSFRAIFMIFITTFGNRIHDNSFKVLFLSLIILFPVRNILSSYSQIHSVVGCLTESRHVNMTDEHHLPENSIDKLEHLFNELQVFRKSTAAQYEVTCNICSARKCVSSGMKRYLTTTSKEDLDCSKTNCDVLTQAKWQMKQARKAKQKQKPKQRVHYIQNENHQLCKVVQDIMRISQENISFENEQLVEIKTSSFEIAGNRIGLFIKILSGSLFCVAFFLHTYNCFLFLKNFLSEEEFLINYLMRDDRKMIFYNFTQNKAFSKKVMDSVIFLDDGFYTNLRKMKFRKSLILSKGWIIFLNGTLLLSFCARILGLISSNLQCVKNEADLSIYLKMRHSQIRIQWLDALVPYFQSLLYFLGAIFAFSLWSHFGILCCLRSLLAMFPLQNSKRYLIFCKSYLIQRSKATKTHQNSYCKNNLQQFMLNEESSSISWIKNKSILNNCCTVCDAKDKNLLKCTEFNCSGFYCAQCKILLKNECIHCGSDISKPLNNTVSLLINTDNHSNLSCKEI